MWTRARRSFLLPAVLLLTTAVTGCALGVTPGVSVTAFEHNFDGHLIETFVGAAADFSPQHQVVAVTCGDVEFRDAVTGKRTGISPHWSGILSAPMEWVRFSPDGDLVLAASGFSGFSNSVRVWLVGDRDPIYEIEWEREELALAQWAPLGFFLPDSRRVAVNQGPTVRFYDARSGIPVDSIPTHLPEVNHIAISNSGDVMAVGSAFVNLIEVYDLTMNTLVDSVRFDFADLSVGESWDEASVYVNQLIFSPDDTKLLAGVEFARNSDDVWRRTLVYDRRGLTVEKTLPGGSFVAFAPDARHMALFRNGYQVTQHPRTGETRVIDATSVQILTYPETKEVVVFPAPRSLRWIGWVADNALWTVRGEPQTYGGWLGGMVRREFDFALISASDTLPPPSPVREVSFH
ncbi:WD40 repeat domain-containing protein [Gemmatimonadota bacterium]